MMGIKDWVVSQLLSKAVVSSRPLSTSDRVLNDEVSNREFSNQVPVADDTSSSSIINQEIQIVVENSAQSHFNTNEKKLDPLAKIESLQIKFLRILQRIGQSRDNLLVAKVLYRMQLATLIRANESDLKRANLRSDRAKRIAIEQEESGQPGINFSLKILVIGKTGVGKSATINSIFDQKKTETNAFQPATDRIQEITGTVNGIKISFIDTPGLLPSSSNSFRRNRKILSSVKRFIRRSPPDIVLYFERLDLINSGYSDFPILKMMTDVFGSAIWFNTIFVLTHASSALPEGSNGYPLNYESYVHRCSDLVQRYIHQAVSDTKIENPVVLVENHPLCKTDIITGEKILPNGQVWKSQFFLLCVCSKILSDINNILEFQDGVSLGPTGASRLPSLPHLLSSFLKHRAGPSEDEVDIDADEEEDDEYDNLPPIRILTKSQFEKMSNNQKKEYLDELDYRETLYMKKQLKEESRKRRESKILKQETTGTDDDPDPPEPMQLPDMAVPLNFDFDTPIYRYRCVITDDKWLARPVLDPHGWDHDVGFDGVNLETSVEIKPNLFASVNGQISKDKHDFSIQSEAATCYVDPRGPTYGLGLDVQSTGKNLIYIIRSNAKLKYLKFNSTECGVSMISFEDKNYFGAKLEDSVTFGKKVELSGKAGCLGGVGQVASGGTLEATFKGRDYPVRNDNLTLSLTALSFKKDTVLSGNFQSEFRVSRGTRMSFGADLNNQKMGKICAKVNSSDHVEIALIAVVTLFRALLKRRGNDSGEATIEE